MSSNAATRAFLGSRPRVLAGRSRSAPSRLREDPQKRNAPRLLLEKEKESARRIERPLGAFSCSSGSLSATSEVSVVVLAVEASSNHSKTIGTAIKNRGIRGSLSQDQAQLPQAPEVLRLWQPRSRPHRSRGLQPHIPRKCSANLRTIFLRPLDRCSAIRPKRR